MHCKAGFFPEPQQHMSHCPEGQDQSSPSGPTGSLRDPGKNTVESRQSGQETKDTPRGCPVMATQGRRTLQRLLVHRAGKFHSSCLCSLRSRARARQKFHPNSAGRVKAARHSSSKGKVQSTARRPCARASVALRPAPGNCPKAERSRGEGTPQTRTSPGSGSHKARRSRAQERWPHSPASAAHTALNSYLKSSSVSTLASITVALIIPAVAFAIPAVSFSSSSLTVVLHICAKAGHRRVALSSAPCGVRILSGLKTKRRISPTTATARRLVSRGSTCTATSRAPNGFTRPEASQ